MTNSDKALSNVPEVDISAMLAGRGNKKPGQDRRARQDRRPQQGGKPGSANQPRAVAAAPAQAESQAAPATNAADETAIDSAPTTVIQNGEARAEPHLERTQIGFQAMPAAAVAQGTPAETDDASLAGLAEQEREAAERLRQKLGGTPDAAADIARAVDATKGNQPEEANASDTSSSGQPASTVATAAPSTDHESVAHGPTITASVPPPAPPPVVIASAPPSPPPAMAAPPAPAFQPVQVPASQQATVASNPRRTPSEPSQPANRPVTGSQPSQASPLVAAAAPPLTPRPIPQRQMTNQPAPLAPPAPQAPPVQHTGAPPAQPRSKLWPDPPPAQSTSAPPAAPEQAANTGTANASPTSTTGPVWRDRLAQRWERHGGLVQLLLLALIIIAVLIGGYYLGKRYHAIPKIQAWWAGRSATSVANRRTPSGQPPATAIHPSTNAATTAATDASPWIVVDPSSQHCEHVSRVDFDISTTAPVAARGVWIDCTRAGSITENHDGSGTLNACSCIFRTLRTH